MTQRVQVQLTVDLTQYRKGLVLGSKGVTVGRGMNDNDRFVRVHFAELDHTLDVLWDSLEITDEEYLAECKRVEKKTDQAIIDTCKEAIVHTGPLGGFQAVYIQYEEDGCPHSYSQGDRAEARRLIQLCCDNKIPIIERRDKKRVPGRPRGLQDASCTEADYPIDREV